MFRIEGSMAGAVLGVEVLMFRLVFRVEVFVLRLVVPSIVRESNGRSPQQSSKGQNGQSSFLQLGSHEIVSFRFSNTLSVHRLHYHREMGPRCPYQGASLSRRSFRRDAEALRLHYGTAIHNFRTQRVCQKGKKRG